MVNPFRLAHCQAPGAGTAMIIGQPGFENMPQVALAKDDEMVEAFSFGSADPDLRVGIQVGTSPWSGLKLDAVAFQDGAELLDELHVAVADDAARPKLGELFTEEHAHVPCNLSHSSTVGVGCRAGDVNATIVQVDNEKDVVGDRPASISVKVWQRCDTSKIDPLMKTSSRCRNSCL